MKFIPITGRLTFVGNSTAPAPKHASRPNANWTYSSLIIREESSNEEITIPNCQVSGNLNRHIAPGEEGTFLVARKGTNRILLGFRNERHETVNDWAMNPTGQFKLPISLFFLGLFLTMFFIGIPIMGYAIYLFYKLQSLPSQLRTGLQNNGFTLLGSRTV